MAVSDAVAEAADLEELEVVLGAVDLFSGRWLAAESVGEPNLAHFPHWQHFSLPATEKRGNVFVCAKSLECVRVGISDDGLASR